MHRLIVVLGASLLGASLAQASDALRPDCLPVAPVPSSTGAETLATQIQDPSRIVERCELFAELAGLAEAGDAQAALALGRLLSTGGFVARSGEAAIRYFEDAADLGATEGLVLAGDVYRDGISVPTNAAAANSYYADALAAGEPVGAIRLGDFFAGIADTASAIEYYQQAADAGSGLALVRIGNLREAEIAPGSSIIPEIRAIYERAVEMGEPTAVVAQALLDERSGAVDMARTTLSEAASAGNIDATVALATMLEQDGEVEEAVAAYSKAADLGSIDAALKLGDLHRDSNPPNAEAAMTAYAMVPGEGALSSGDLYRDGLGGMAADGSKAGEHYAEAFRAGLDAAAGRLGALYLDGKLVPQSIEMAASYFQYVPDAIPNDRLVAVADAILAGDPGTAEASRALGILERALGNGQGDAAERLGGIYFDGELVARDLVAAERYFAASPAGAPPPVLLALGNAYRHGTDGMSADSERAIALYDEAAAGGVAEAAMQLGDLFEAQGNTERAAATFIRAADLGAAEGALRAGDLLAGSGDGAGAVAAYQRAADAGVSAANARLGDIFLAGELANRDLFGAADAYERTADGVPPSALYDIGAAFVAREAASDFDRGVAYLERALGSDDRAAKLLGEVFSNGDRAAIDPDRADGYFSQVTSPVPARSALALGLAYRDGTNVEFNGAKAVRYLTAAVAGGEARAAPELGQLYLDGG